MPGSTGLRARRRGVTEINHERLMALLPDLADMAVGDTRRLASQGYMDLVVEATERGVEGSVPFATISLAHYHEQNGDLMADPEMLVKVYLDPEFLHADALHYQNDGVGAFLPSYGEQGGQKVVFPKAKRDNQAFLATWLRNLKQQGHTVVHQGSRTETSGVESVASTCTRD